MSTQEERRVGENVRLRKKLARALESETAIRAERRSLARRVRGYIREVLELETKISELRARLGTRDRENAKLQKYEALIFKLVERVKKDAQK